jgi:hypothetical protein
MEHINLSWIWGGGGGYTPPDVQRGYTWGDGDD